MDTSGLSYSQALYDTKFGGESDSSWLTIRHKFFVGLESWIALLRSDQAQLNPNLSTTQSPTLTSSRNSTLFCVIRLCSDIE